MRILSTLTVISITVNLFGQFTSTPCGAGPLPTPCAANTINLTSSMPNSGYTDPEAENGTGCSSVGSDITAGTIYDYDGWFTTVADASGIVDVYAAIISGDPVVGVYSMSGSACSSPTMTLLGCDDDGGSGLDAYINITGLTAGATYYVRVWDYNGGTGTYEVTTNGGTPPVNDDCASATGLSVNAAPTTGTNYCATVETSDWNDCEGNTENNVWYSFTTTVDGDITVNFSSIDCFGSGAGIDVTIFSGTCGSLGSYDCASVNAGSSGSISVTTAPAGTYFVMVDGNNSGGATSLCDFDIDVDFTGCMADGGTNTSPALVNNCAGNDVTVMSATGTVNTYLGDDPCIGWGFWVESDPLNAFPGLSGIGTPPSGGNPAGGGDPNYVGVWTSGSYPLANGENPTLPDEANGVTYFIAPVTLSNCATGEITTNCFDIGNYTEIYFNPEITYTYSIDCDNVVTPTTQVSITVEGGLPSVNGSNFSLSISGSGTLSTTTVADGGTFNVTGIADGGSFTVTVTDGMTCSQTISVGPIDASVYCPTCGADIGTWDVTHTGDGSTTANSGTLTTNSAPVGPFILCYGDFLDLAYVSGASLPPKPSGSQGTGIDVAVYDSYPTTGILNPDLDPSYACYNMSTGVYSGQGDPYNVFPDENNGFTLGTISSSQYGCSAGTTDNTIWLVITTYDKNGDFFDNFGYYNTPPVMDTYDYDGDGCIDQSAPIQVTYLNDIQASPYQSCGQVQLYITGGYPEFFPGNYDINITSGSPGTLGGTPITHGEYVTITGLSPGDVWSIDVLDGTGCTKTLSGTFTFTDPVVSFATLASDYCENDPIENLTGSPTPVTVTSGTFDLDFVEDGYSLELTWEVLDNAGNVVYSGTGNGIYSSSGPFNPYGYTTPSLASANGPYSLVLYDDFGDGQDGTSTGGQVGSTTVTNNITGEVVATAVGNWGSSITLALGNFNSTEGTFTGPGITDNGDGTATFDPGNANLGSNTVTYTYDNNDGCLVDYSQSTTVHPNPLLAPTTDPSICAGETILLSDYTPGEANGVPGTGTWYTDAGFSTTASTTAFTPTNGQQFFYQYVATAGGCTDDASITVTVNALPTATASNNGPLCVGDQLDLTGGANGMTSYSWAGPSSYSDGTQSPTVSTSVTTAMAGTYTITVDDGTCTNTATTTVVVNALPTATASNNGPLCEGDQLDLTGGANGMTSYSWAGPSAYSNGTQSPTVSASVTTAMAGDYTITVNDGNCTNTATTTVVVNTLPTATATNNGPLCEGDQLDLTGGANGMTSYSWAGPSAYSNGTQSPTVSTSVTTAMAGDYTITVDDGTCTNTATTTVVVNALPTATATNNGPLCEGDQLDLTGGANGMTSYSWAGPSAYSDGTQSPTVSTSVTTAMAGDYTITVDDGTCTNTATTTVVVNTLPTATATNNGPLCEGDQLDLTGGANGMTSYSWAGPSAYSNGTQSPTVSTSVTTAMAGDYTITVDDGTCTNTATTTVVVNALPTATATNNGPLCEGDQLDLTGGANGMTSYSWAGPSAYSDGTQSPTVSTSVTTAMAGDYTITVDDGTCTNTATTTVVVNTLPTATASNNGPLCEGDQLDLTGGANGMTSYSWSGPSAYTDGTQSPTVSTSVTTAMAGDYTITIGNGTCTNTATTTVVVNTLPTATATNNGPLCEGDQLDLTGGDNGMTSYSWTGPSAYSDATQSPTVSASVTTAMAGVYTLTIDDGTCTNTATTTVVVNTNPILSAVTNPEVCANANSINLGAFTPTVTNGVAGTGQWYTGTDNTGTPVTGTQTGLVDGDQFYYEFTSTAGSCTDNATITVTVDPVPVLDPVTNPSVCADANTIDLTTLTPAETAGVAGTGQWYTGNSNAGTPVSGSQTVNNGDQFFYEYTSTVGSCTDDVTITVTVNPMPVLSNVTNPSVCADANSIDLSTLTPTETAGVPGTGQWYTGSDNTGTPVSGIQSGLTDGDQFYYEYTSTAGTCTDSHLLTVTVNPLPVLDPVTDPEVCADAATIDLSTLTPNETAGVAGSGQWYNGTSNADPAVSGVQSVTDGQTFYYEYTSTTGSCATDLTITVTVNPLPTATDQSAPGACEDTPGGGTIAGIDLTSYESSVNGGAGITYNWYSDAGLTSPVGTPTSVTVSNGDIYYVEVVDGTTTCSDIAQVDFTVYSIPVVNNLSRSVCEDVLGSGTTSGVDLTGNNSAVNSGGGLTFTWYTDAGLTSPVGTPTSATVNNGDIFYVNVDNGNCSDVATVTYSVTSTITLTDPNPQLCEDVEGGGTYAGYDLTSINGSVYSGSGSTTYTWYESDMSTLVATPTNITLNDGDQYYVDIADGNCSNAIMVNFNVNPLPSVTPVTDLEMCDEGGSIATFDLTSVQSGVNAVGPTYNWFSDAGLTSGIATPGSYSSASGTVYVQVQDANGCLNNEGVNLIVNPLPTATTASLEECNTGSNQATFDLTSVESTVDGGAGNTINWYSDAVLATSIGTPAAYQTVSTTVYAEVVDANTCSNSVGVTLTVNPLPTAADQSPAGVCEDSPGAGTATIDLTSYESGVNGGAGVTINWFSDATLSTAVATPTSEPASNGSVYYAQVIDNTTLCEDTAQVTITVFSAPTATDLTPSLCEDVLGSGQTSGVDLTANNTNINNGAGLTFTWYDDAGLTTATATPSSATVNDADDFYVEISNGNCTSIAQVVYTVTSTITLNDPLPAECETTEGSLQYSGYDLTSLNNSIYSGSGSTVYTWYESDMVTPVAGSNNILLNNGDQYYIEVVDGNCSNTIMISFTVNPLPTMNPVAGLELCDDGTAQATFDLTSEETNINATGPTYNWYSDAGLSIAIATPSAYSISTSTAYLEVVDGNGCSNSYGLDLTVNPLPTANTTSSDICDDGTGQATFDLSSLESTVDGGAGNTVNWFSDAALTTAIGTPSAYLTASTTVYAEVTDATTGCVSSNSVDLNVTASPSAPVLTNDTAYCEGQNISDLSATGAGGTITWYSDAALTTVVGSGSNFTPTLSGTGSATYYVTEDLGGCISETDSVTVTINPNPVASFTTNTTNGNVPLDVEFTNGSTGSSTLTYDWTFGDGNTSTSQDIINTFAEIGTFTTVLMVTDSLGCTDTTATEITVGGEFILIIPNIFSPNGDGNNDIWNLEGTNIVDIQGTIMNRWGQVMFQFDILEMGWDGRTTSGLEASEGTYYYIIDATGADGNVYNYQGPFELVR